MTQIKKILDKQGNEVFIRTSTKAVIDGNGYTAESRLQAMQDEINQAQLAVGAVPSDLTPTEDSSNWVTSGGVYNAVQPQNINYDNSQSGMSATNVQSAVDELSQNIKSINSEIYGYIGNIVGLKKITGTGAVETASGAVNRTLVADVSEYVGQTISVGGRLYAKSDDNTYCWWTIHDANGNVIEKSEVSNLTSAVQYDNFKFPIPENAKTLYVQGSDGTKMPYAIIEDSYTQVKRYVKELREWNYLNDNNIASTPDSIVNYIITNSGGQWMSGTAGSSVYNVSKGDIMVVTANNAKNAYCFLLTQVGNFSSLPSYMAGTGKIRIAPGATMIIEVPADGYFVFTNDYYLSDSLRDYAPSFVCKASKSEQSANNTVKVFRLVDTALKSESTGLPSNFKTYTVGYAHTPKMIKLRGTIKILTDVSGFICWYDKNKQMLSNTAIAYNTEQYNSNASYFALTLNTASGTKVIPNEVKIEGIWDGNDELFWPIPTDNGYINLAFAVDVPKNPTYSVVTSELTEQFTRTSNHAILHLPPSYNEEGTPTKLIIYLHGASARYDDSSTRFGANVRYSPEWSAAGFAQLDVDMIPDIYSSSLTSTAGSGDDADCVFAAYNFVIEHYNIARDGVYLFGRSRGGQAVLECLAHYNPSKMPIVAALSNAGANTTMVYSLFTATMNNERWQFFANAMGIPSDGRPTISTTNKRLVTIPSVVEYLRNNIDIWWKKACVAFAMMTENNTDYQTPIEIFDFICDSYQNDNARRYSDWVKQLKFHSPVPLRFDWCNGDTIQDWTTTSPYNYSVCVKDAFVNWDVNSEYRFWPQALDSNKDPHYHEDVNFYNGDYTLPNKNIITNPSMAQTEWMLWAMSKDSRFNGCNAL